MAKTNKKGKGSTKLANPLTRAANRIAALFAGANGVATKFDFSKATLRVYVENAAQAEAVEKLLPATVSVGPMMLNIAVYPGNAGKAKKLAATNETVTAAVIKAAFKGNRNFKRAFTAKDSTGTVWTFVEMSRTAVSYQADSLLNYYGCESALPADILLETVLDIEPGTQVSTFVQA